MNELGTGRTARLRRLLLLCGLMLTLAACGAPVADTSGAADAPAGDAVTLDEFPDGIGRGYPRILVEETGSGGIAPGEPAPDFRLQLEDGRSLTLADLRGQPVMLNFWATWCGPCRAEMPDIVAAYEREADLVVIAVNVQEDPAVIAPFAEEFAMSMPVGLDQTGDLRQRYALRGMPSSVFIDRTGNISTVWSGLLTEDRLDDLLAEIR